MKSLNILLLGLILGIFISCEKNDNEVVTEPKTEFYSFSGKVQKGPFITGTNVTVNELNSDLSQTGKSFTATITADDGSFSLGNIELNSNLALLTANGFYFNEILGQLSGSALILQAIAEISNNETVNINVLTHLAKNRVENLVSNGHSFNDAYDQAKSEMLSFLNVNDTINTNFEDFDITSDEEYNAILLAFSIILQRYSGLMHEIPTLTAELTQLLSNLAVDFEDDGQITDQALIDTLLYNISIHNLINIRNNIENRYSDLGQNVTVPNFEVYINKFQEKHSSILYTNFTYPDSATVDPIMDPDVKIENLLYKPETSYSQGAYAIAAIVPLYSTLRIKFICDNTNCNYIFGGPISGWGKINDYPNGFTLNAQRQNEIATMLLHLETSGNATIEYYENDTIAPAFTKNISW